MINKTTKILISIVLTIIMIVALASTTVLAADPITMSISRARYRKEGETLTPQKEYQIQTTETNGIFQLIRVEEEGGEWKNKAINYYCVDAEKSATWQADETQRAVYDKSYDLVEDKAAISALTVDTYKNVATNGYYSQLLWVLDNMYVEDGTARDQLLSNAGIVYGYNTETEREDLHYDPSVGTWTPAAGNSYYGLLSYRTGGVDVKLEVEEVEAVRQLAIWYFTNYMAQGQQKYDCYTADGASKPIGTWFEFEESNDTIKKYKQEQAAILFDYLVDTANEHSTYDGRQTGTLTLTPANPSGQEVGDNYKFGPLTMTKSDNVIINGGVKVVTGTASTDISSSATLQNASGATITNVTPGQEFYVIVPKNAIENDTIQIKMTGTYMETEKTLWVKEVGSDVDAEQPIVEVNPTPREIPITVNPVIEKKFDLALRKEIIAVNGRSTASDIQNENKEDARRAITVDTNTIPVTATYKHRKDPVVVKRGDTVTYRIHIYNEGEIDGYASRITDVLASGLSIYSTEQITSNKGNKYDVEVKEGNVVVFTLTGTATSITAFGGTLDSDYIDVTCSVTQAGDADGVSKHYLSNIAYIAEAKNSSDRVVANDRDGTESTPNNTSSSNNSKGLNVTNRNDIYKGNSSKDIFNDTDNSRDYFEGQEDDDDFETVVVLPKAFDLKLMKFISAINGQATNRAITIDSSKLKDGTKTTADYDVSKVPLKVKTGDVVTYTIRVYNEGEIDGYASEITEDIPTGLSFDAASNPDWTLSDDGKKVTTDKLSREKGTENLLVAFNSSSDDGQGSGLSYKDVTINLTVTATRADIIRNEAEISEDTNSEGYPVDDRDSDTEEWKKEDSNENYENNPEYPKYKEDDEDYDNIKLLASDLALRKFISAVGDKDTILDNESRTNYNRVPQVNTTALAAGTADTAIYNHSKEPVKVNVGGYVLYTIRVYNEGDFDVYASEITDYLPEYLTFVTGTATGDINNNWEEVAGTRNVKTVATAPNTVTLLKAFDATREDAIYNAETHTAGSDHGLSYMDVQIICQVNDKALMNKDITNIAEITEYKDENGVEFTPDRDSSSENFPDSMKTDEYNGNGKEGDYVKGQEDDDDFEKLVINKFDLALRKFVVKVNDREINDRIPNISDAEKDKLVNGNATYDEGTTLEKIHPKTKVNITKGSTIVYTIRVYNEGEVDGYAAEITDYLPAGLSLKDDSTINTENGWVANGQTITTTKLADQLIKAFDKTEKNLDYKDIQVECVVNDQATNDNLKNIAEITIAKNKNNEEVKDVDSTPKDVNIDGYNPTNPENGRGEQDDDDFEDLNLANFDLALRKFITSIDTLQTQKDENSTPIFGYGREPKVSYENNKITYTHPKDVVKVNVGDIVIYTLRAYNEGEIAGFAEKISDDIPEYLEFLPDYSINKEYKWVMYDKDGNVTTKVKEAVKIETDYTSKANGEALMAEKSLTENPNLLNAFDKTKEISDTNPDYVDVQVAFKVKDPKSNKTVITNKAQISEDADEDGDPIEDRDSIPDKWNEGEDDQDIENVSVEYFDLSLLKYVTKTIVTENGKTKTTKTGNTGAKTDITPKVEVYRRSIHSTIVKFEFTIKVTNEGDIAGYAKELTDYVPKGLKFYASDNKGWKDEGNNVISTTLLKDTLLQPGQSATVKVILRWVNGENNLGLKTNVAEISKDQNDRGVPDRDSTPDNKKKGEDDIDDAPVLLTISTGIRENTIAYVTGALVILVVLGLGVAAIKRYVL